MAPGWRAALLVVAVSIFIAVFLPTLAPLFDQISDERIDSFIDWDWERRPSQSWKPSDPCPIEISGIGPSSRTYGSRDYRRYNFDSMKAVHEALLQYDNIRSIYLNVPSRACLNGSDRYALPLSQTGGVKYLPAPEILSLDGHSPESCWVVRSSRANRWRWRWRWRQWQIWSYWKAYWNPLRARSSMELWLEAMDFSRIHTLHLNSTHILSQEAQGVLATSLPSLHTLVIQGTQSDFLLALPPNSLKHLKWQNMHQPAPPKVLLLSGHQPSPMPVFQHLGASLLTLDIRNDDSTRFPPRTLSKEELHELTTLTPNLTHLTLNLARRRVSPNLPDLTWPWEALKILATGFPNLTHLTVYFELPATCRRKDIASMIHRIPKCSGADQYAKPMLSSENAKKMVEYLARHKTGKTLESVTFRSGDWAPPREDHMFEGMAVNVDLEWMDGKRVWVDCAPGEEEGEMKCEGGDALLGLEECWWEYRCVGSGCYGSGEDKDDGVGAEYWDQVCPGEGVVSQMSEIGPRPRGRIGLWSWLHGLTDGIWRMRARLTGR